MATAKIQISFRLHEHDEKWGEKAINHFGKLLLADLRIQHVQREVAEKFGMETEWDDRVNEFTVDQQNNVAYRLWTLISMINDPSIETVKSRESRKYCFFKDVWEGQHRAVGLLMSLLCSRFNVVTGTFDGPNSLTWECFDNYGLLRARNKDETEVLSDYVARKHRSNSLDVFKKCVTCLTSYVTSAPTEHASAPEVRKALQTKSECHGESKKDTTLRSAFPAIAEILLPEFNQMRSHLKPDLRPDFSSPQFSYPRNTKKDTLMDVDINTLPKVPNRHIFNDNRDLITEENIPALVLCDAVRDYINDPFNPGKTEAFKQFFTTSVIESNGEKRSDYKICPPFFVTVPSILQDRGKEPGQITTDQVNFLYFMPRVSALLLASLHGVTLTSILRDESKMKLVEYAVYFHGNPYKQDYGWLQPNTNALRNYYENDSREGYFTRDRSWLPCAIFIVRIINGLLTCNPTDNIDDVWWDKNSKTLQLIFVTAPNHAEGMNETDLIQILCE